MAKKQDLTVITPAELSLVENNVLNERQLKFILKRTPASQIRKRPAKGGGEWEYVPGGYFRKILNLMFGWDWDFEILSEAIFQDTVVVKGKLTVRCNGRQLIKTQFGKKEIQFENEYYTNEKGQKAKRKTDRYLDIGNDFKSAATDCLKKCAAELGICSDVYNKEDFQEVIVREITHQELFDLYEVKQDSVPATDIEDIERILKNKETKSYGKLFNYLSQL
jgi:hypothetical protein